MLQRNSTTTQFRRTRKSALTIINPLIDLANIRISALLQQELVDISEAKGQYGVDDQWHAKFEDTTWETSREDDRLILQ